MNRFFHVLCKRESKSAVAKRSDMKTLRNFLYIVELNTLVVPMLSMICTFLCRKINFIFEIPTNLVGIAVIFPLVFSIASAYKRREQALRSFALLKSSLASLHLAYRNCLDMDGNHTKEHAHMVQNLLESLVDCLRAVGKRQAEASKNIYQIFQKLSRLQKKMLQHDIPSPYVSATRTFLHQAMVSFEDMQHIACYHTPAALRAYSRIFLMAFPILFSPYFAGIDLVDMNISGYFVAVFYSIVLVSLGNIQDHLENPYDGVGLDGLHLELTDEYRSLFLQNS